MKNILKKHKKLFIFLAIVVVFLGIIGNKIYKNFNLTSEVYRKCEGGIYNFSCEYYMFKKSGKVFMVKQNISNDYERDERDNFEKLLLKHGIDNVTKKCSGYGYCKDTLGVAEMNSGNYSIDNGKIKIEWDSNYNDVDYYRIKDGEIWVLDSELEITNTSYYPVEDYNKWNKCRSKNNCDEVFSIEDPLNDIDYNSIYQDFESNLISQNCSYVMEYAFKDITGDGINEILLRRSSNGKDWRLIQIYYINTWAREILPLGNNEIPFDYTEISEVYDGGYIYISGNHLGGNYYKVSEDGFLLDYYAADSEYDLPSQKSLYDDISDWKPYPRDEEYCKS